jgi:putative membrane protein
MTRIVLSLMMIVGLVTAAPPRNQPAAAPAPSASAFAAAVAGGNQFEIDSSKMALSRSNSKLVKAFAQRMIDDHRVADGKFKHALTEAKLPPSPAKLSAEHRAVLADLKSKKAAAFDKAYIEAQYTAHVETVELFKAYAEAGDNARLQFFAQEMLPTLQSHLDQVGKMR